MTVISRRTRTWISVATVCALAVALIPLLPPLNNAQASVFTPNVFGVVQQAPPDPNGPPWSAWEAQSLPTQIQSISIYRVSVTGSSPNSQLVRTLIASDTRSGADDSVIIDDTTFTAYVDFQAPYTYEMDVTPVSPSAGGTTTFRLPGPAGDASTFMAFRLQDARNPGLYFKTPQWACRADNDTNCVDSMRVRNRVGPGAWVPVVDDTSTFPTYSCDTSQDPTCSVGGSGDYWGWSQYQTWEIPAVSGASAAQPVRIQWVYRPVEDTAVPDPNLYPYPYITVEIYAQGGSVARDGWGCTTLNGEVSQTWWAGQDDTWATLPYPTWLNTVSSTFGCAGGGPPLDTDLEYEVTLRTAEPTFIPIFTSGYLTDMTTGVARGGSNYEMTVSGAPRKWQWMGGQQRRNSDDTLADDAQSYTNYYDATNLDWGFSASDGRIVAQQTENPALEECFGVGMAATSSNGNGSSPPRWNPRTQQFSYNTEGKHFMPANIDDSGHPNAPTSAGLVYIGESEIVIDTDLAICMWADSGLDSVPKLNQLKGRVLSQERQLKSGASVSVSVDSSYLRISASGYTYSTADLTVAPQVGLEPLSVAYEATQVAQSTYTIVKVYNNDDSDPMTVTALTVTGGSYADFAVGETTCGTPVAANDFCEVEVIFAPKSSGGKAAQMAVATSVRADAYAVPLTGTGVDLPTPIAPGPPRSPEADAGNASAAVTWLAPATVGDYPVTSYEVASSPSGRKCMSSSLTCTVTNLTNGIPYTFRVRALSGAGWGPWSDPTNVVTPTDPNPPVKAAIVITGSRGDVRGKTGVIVTGTTEGMGMGAILKAWTRFPGESAYTEGSVDILVSADGSFTWQRRTPRKMYVTVRTADGSVTSNRVIVSAR